MACFDQMQQDHPVPPGSLEVPILLTQSQAPHEALHEPNFAAERQTDMFSPVLALSLSFMQY